VVSNATGEDGRHITDPFEVLEPLPWPSLAPPGGRATSAAGNLFGRSGAGWYESGATSLIASSDRLAGAVDPWRADEDAAAA
jgi:hypothetical protein